MIFGKDLKTIWAKHRAEFLKLYTQEQGRAIHGRDLEYRYTDTAGMTYFGFPKDMAMPVERLAQIYKYNELLFKGMSSAEDEAIDRAISDALEVGLLNPKEKSAAKIGSLLIEREKRRRMVFHTELILNLVAVQLIREDEDATVFSNDIQMAKVEQFGKDAKEGSAYPFFLLPELKQLSDLFQMSKAELEKSWLESLIAQQVLSEALKSVYTSVKG